MHINGEPRTHKQLISSFQKEEYANIARKMIYTLKQSLQKVQEVSELLI